MADDPATVSLTIDEFLAIGEHSGRLRARIAWLEYRVDELLRANAALVERSRAAAREEPA